MTPVAMALVCILVSHDLGSIPISGRVNCSDESPCESESPRNSFISLVMTIMACSSILKTLCALILRERQMFLCSLLFRICMSFNMLQYFIMMTYYDDNGV